MNSNRVNLYLSLTWLFTVGIAYAVGWWTGVRSVTNLATDAAQSSMWIVLGVLAVVAIIAGIMAFRMRGYLDRHHNAT